jgi:hypothetical protein
VAAILGVGGMIVGQAGCQCLPLALFVSASGACIFDGAQVQIAPDCWEAKSWYVIPIHTIGLGKPGQAVLRPEQIYGLVGNRAPTRQRLPHGDRPRGALTVIDHQTKTSSSMFDDFCEPAADISHTLSARPAQPSRRRMK